VALLSPAVRGLGPRHELLPPRAAVRCVVDANLEPLVGANAGISGVQVGLAEEADLNECVDVLMEAFYKDAMTIAAAEFTAEEMERLAPPLTLLNGGLKRFTRFWLRQQCKGRCGEGLRSLSVRRPAQGSSLMICAHKPDTCQIVGVVEVSVEPRDGRVPGDVRPLHLPWSAPSHVAYISNLAVDSSQRKRGVGSRLLRAAEAVSSGWGFGEVYLHVALAEDRLLAFYQRQQYAPLPEMDAPPWVLAISGREATRYHVRKLDSEPVERLAAAADAIKAARPRRGERG